jgi:DNA replication licensing factor MCM4
VRSPGGDSTTPSDFDGDKNASYLYGTDIDDAQITKAFHRFFDNFRLPDAPADEPPYYHQQLQRLWEAQETTGGIKFPINGRHIASFSKRFYTDLINFPTEVIPMCDRELFNIAVRVMKIDPEDPQDCQVQIHGLEEKDQKLMRLMNPMVDIERLVSIKGIVIRVSDLVPDMKTGHFECTACNHEVMVPLSHWTIEEPTLCEACKGKHTFRMVHNDCSFGDRQFLKLQETPELVPEGETPHSVVVHCYDDLVDHVRPGDRIEITGIYRASAVRPMNGFTKCSAVYRTHVDAVSIASEAKQRIEQCDETKELYSEVNAPVGLSEMPDMNPENNKPEDIEFNRQIRALAEERDEEGKRTIMSKLVRAFAPSIYEEDDVKKGILCQLFGGTQKAPSRISRGKCRPEINVLLCGDPSTAKSQLLQFSYKLAARAVYTSGKGSSAVGLTASINKDPSTKELVLESGALVLADRGLCCIDEFDKMDDKARAILHEAMEQQTVSVAKAGIVCSLNARTAILASANPKESAYDMKKSVVENINLPKNLMTRFDLIWLMLDKRLAELDRNLAEHLVSMYSESGTKQRAEPPISGELFRRYVGFARRYVFPRLTDEASEKLAAEYLSLRHQGAGREAITATPRNLESLIRISESLAKMELREEVTADDVAEASRLIKAATYAAMVDPETGLIDMEQLIQGMGMGRRRRQKELESMLEEILAEKSGNESVTLDTARAAMNERLGSNREQLLHEDEFMKTVRRLEDEGRCRRRGKALELRTAA